MADLTAANPVAVALAWEQAHPGVLAAFGGADHVSGVMEAPWPHLVVTSGEGNNMRGFRWDTVQEVTLEVYGAPEDRGRAEVKRLALIACQALVELPERELPATEPVVSLVESSGTWAYAPLATGQPRQIAGLYLTIHPPSA